MVITDYIDLLPEGYLEKLTIPEIVEGFHYDDTTGIGRIVVSGDVSHYKQTDNPIVEIFRAVEESTRTAKGGKHNTITVGCPRYDSATSSTSCNFLPNNIESLKGDEFDQATKEAFERVKDPFEKTLTAYFQQENGGFRDYQVIHFLINTVATDNKDLFDLLVATCDKQIKEFLKAQGYKPPTRRLRQTAQASLPTWKQLLNAVSNL